MQLIPLPLAESVKPYSAQGEKKKQVEEMFDNIAHSYDFLNHFFSLGIDILWRKKAIRILRKKKPETLLDMATGTADFAIEAARMKVGASRIVGMDISQKMLDVGRKKIKEKGFENLISLMQGDSEALPLPDNSFDAFTVAFGVRNFQHLDAGLKELYRVTKPGGTGMVLEFSRPRKFPMKQFFGFYFKRVMPLLGKLVSKDHRAYSYLPESVAAFPDGEDFVAIMKNAGFTSVESMPLTGGIASLYIAIK